MFEWTYFLSAVYHPSGHPGTSRWIGLLEAVQIASLGCSAAVPCGFVRPMQRCNRSAGQKNFWSWRRYLGTDTKKYLSDRETVLKELVDAARRVDKAAFGESGDFGQAHQALLKALDRAADFIKSWALFSAGRLSLRPENSCTFVCRRPSGRWQGWYRIAFLVFA